MKEKTPLPGVTGTDSIFVRPVTVSVREQTAIGRNLCQTVVQEDTRHESRHSSCQLTI